MEDHRSLNWRPRPTLWLERVVILPRRRPHIVPWEDSERTVV
jgi:hypothetical protein